MRISWNNSWKKAIEMASSAHSVDSFLALAWALVSLTFNSLALLTILSLYSTKMILLKHSELIRMCLMVINYLPLACTNLLSDLTAVNTVVHQQELEILLVGDEQLFESVWQKMSSSFGLFASDFHLFLVASHSSSSEAINTSNLPVRIGLKSKEIRLKQQWAARIGQN